MADQKKEINPNSKTPQHTYEKIDHQNQLAWSLRVRGTKQSYIAAQEAYELAVEINYPKGIAEALRSQSHYYNMVSNYDMSFQCAIKSHEMFREAKNRTGEATALSLLGNSSFSLGDYENALKYYLLCMEIQKELNDNLGLMTIHTNVANVYGVKKDFDNALKYYFDGLEQQRDISSVDEDVMIRIHNNKAVITGNIGSIYAEMGEYALAIEFFTESVELAKKYHNNLLITSNQNNTAECYLRLGDLINAEKFFRIGLKSSMDSENKLGHATSLHGLGELALAENNVDLAIEHLENARKIAEDFLLKRIVTDIYSSLSGAYSKKKDYKMALYFHKKFYAEKELLFNEEANKKMQNLMILHQVEVLKNESESQRESNEKLTKLNEEIAEKTRRIIESIDYAKHIQDSILPHPSSLKQYFPDSFVFSRPKDIISGDFFWMYEKGNEILFSAVDCTGHGVSGALMSVVANSLLNQVTSAHPVAHPSFILNEVNHFIKRTLSAHDESGLRDSMDIAICTINKTREELLFSGAHNSLYLISGGTLTEYKGDSISLGNNASVKFTDHKVKLKKGDCLYIFTDGFADQKGGINRKKFYYEPFKALLLRIHTQPMEKQLEEIDRTMSEWMSTETQIDDMLVVGVKI